MAYDKSHTIDAFLAATAAKQPTPGGGSVAALAGGLAAAMGEMVLNYSLGKKDLAQHQDALKHAVSELNRARVVMLELMVEDQAAYDALTAARKLPENDSQRSSKIDAALAVCIRIPQTIGTTALAILQICDRVVEIVNPYLLSDLSVCAELAMATLRCAAYNVRVNLAGVQSVERFQIDSSVNKQMVDASRTIQRVIPRIWAKVGPS
jgi:glutamate formiminotransferase/formiminotetrahydrofolate cyclodeaminase